MRYRCPRRPMTWCNRCASAPARSRSLVLTRFLHANRYPPPDQVRGHASLKNALAAASGSCRRLHAAKVELESRDRAGTGETTRAFSSGVLVFSRSEGDRAMKRWRRESALDLYNLVLAAVLLASPWLFTLTNRAGTIDLRASG